MLPPEPSAASAVLSLQTLSPLGDPSFGLVRVWLHWLQMYSMGRGDGDGEWAGAIGGGGPGRGVRGGDKSITSC